MIGSADAAAKPMSTRSTRSRIAACICAAATLAMIAPAAAQEIRIGPSSCEGTTLLARHAKASDVLQQLSTTLGFKVQLEEPLDALVTIQSTRPADELIALLLASRNAIVTQAVDPMCPGTRRVTAVGLLKGGGSGATGRQPPPRPGGLFGGTTPAEREQEEM
jgi:hypothetical protein